MKISYEWKSDLAEIFQAYIKGQRQTGLKFEKQERYLRHFDSFYYYNGYTGIDLTKSMLNKFIYNKEERPVSHYNKELVMKNFAVYLNERGHHVYVPEIRTVLPKSNFIPHIYTKEELQRFFVQWINILRHQIHIEMLLIRYCSDSFTVQVSGFQKHSTLRSKMSIWMMESQPFVSRKTT